MPKAIYDNGEIEIQGATAQEIARSLRKNIETGAAKPGMRLPSTRTVAPELGVNRNTVAAAYKKLIQAGLIEPKGRSLQVAPPPIEDFENQLVVPEGLKDISFANPDPDMLPPLKRTAMRLGFDHHQYGQNPDNPKLLSVFTEWADEFGLPQGEQMVCPGTVETLDRLFAVYTEPRDQIVVEDPSYMKLLHVVRGLGLTPVGVPLDQEGMRLDILRKAINKRTRAIVLTPVAQNPTGVTYSVKRLAAISALLDKHPDILVIEDEHMGAMARTRYNSTYKKGRRHWAILSSVAKYLGPDLRLAILTGSPTTVKRLKTRRAATGQWVSMILQELVTALLQDQKVRDKFAKAAAIYASRREVIIGRLSKRGIDVLASDGFNLWIPSSNEDRFAHELARRGWLVRTGHDFVVGAEGGVRLTFASLAEKDCIMLADAIADSLAACGQ